MARYHTTVSERLRLFVGRFKRAQRLQELWSFLMAQLFPEATMESAKTFLENIIKVIAYTIHTILSDKGIQFPDLPKNRFGISARLRGDPFDRVCWANGIEHRISKANHPWTNGQVERMNRT